MSAAIGIAAWVGALMALVAGRRLFARVRGLPEAGDAPVPPISVIIPARDEAENLAKLLPALASQTLAAHEVIVVDDQSSDATAGVARAAGARVVSGRELPEGWFGKPWACRQGADAATGAWLLFLDADVEPEPEFLGRMAALMDGRSVVSVCPWHRIERPYEELSVFFNLLMLGGIGAFTAEGDDAAGVGLFGQTMLIPREIYEEAGGHGAVRRTVLENFHLSRRLGEIGVRRVCRLGRGAISMRMFPEGYGQMKASWAKGFASGAGLTSPAALALSSLWLSGLMMVSAVALMTPLAGWSGRVAAGLAFGVSGLALVPRFREAGRFSWWSALAFPVSLFFYQVVFLRALWRRRAGGTTQWKGRDVA